MPPKKASLSFLGIGFLLVTLLAFYSFSRKEANLISTRVVEAMKNLIPSKTENAKALSSADKMFSLYDGVETFVLFIGYPRSRHSLIGALLDAHPEIIIPHEYNVLGKLETLLQQTLRNKNMQKYLLFHNLHLRSHEQALFGNRANNSVFTKTWGYNYNVPGLWQGSYDKKIKVIGDKKGGKTSMILAEPDNETLLEQVSEIVKVPIKFIHVIRNPFDNIATRMLGQTHSRDKVREEGAEKVNSTESLDNVTTVYFKLAASNQRTRERYGDAVLDIPGHEMVLRPRETIQKLCDHLGVTCSEEYIEQCSKILYGTPSVTRNTVVWSKEQKNRVTYMMRNYPFLKDYSFDKYPN